MYKEFPVTMPAIPAAENPSVCIVTSELVGPFKNGGMGTAMTGLAKSLAAAGFPVTVLNTGTVWYSNVARDEWRKRYGRIGIDLRWLTQKDMAGVTGPLSNSGFGVPFLVYEYLRQQRFDIIHFNDCMGEGLYCLTMKRLGAAFRDSLLCVAHHGPSQWVFELNRYLPDSVMLSACNFAERLSTRCADLLWSPSRYLLDWSKANGFIHTDATYVQQYVIPTRTLFDEGPELPPPSALAPRNPVRPTEIVFFARLEERKGLRLFCNVLKRLNGTLTERNISITFLGKPGFVGMTDAMTYIRQQAAGWRFRWQAVTELGQQEAIEYLQSRAIVAVMPSPADNSPCTVYEALALGIPFIAARTGGIPELIDPADRQAVLFDYTPEALSARLEQIIRDGMKPARPSQTQEANRRRWLAMHRQWRDFLPPEQPTLEPPRGVCAIIDHVAGDALEETLASLAQVSDVHRIVIANRSAEPVRREASATSIRVIEFSVADPDVLLEEIRDDPAEILLLMRAGTRLCVGAMPQVLRAMRSPHVDGLIPAALDGDGTKRIVTPPLGGSPCFSFYEGVAITGGLFIKAERLFRATRGHALAVGTEFLGLADLAVADGLDLWPYAEPVLWHPNGFAAPRPSSGDPERIAAYGRISVTERYYIAAIGYAGIARRDPPLGHRRALIMRLSKLGLGGPVRLMLRVVPLSVINIVYGWLRRPIWRFLKG